MICDDLMKICVTVPMKNISRLGRYFSSTYYFYSLHIWTVSGRQILYSMQLKGIYFGVCLLLKALYLMNFISLVIPNVWKGS